MKINKISILTVLSVSLLLIGGTADNVFAITVMDEDDPIILANIILGGGVTIVGGTQSITGNGNNCEQFGTFDDGLAAGIGMEDGIVISSGHVLLITDTNTSDNISCDAGGAGDADLDALTTGITEDAAILEFDFEFGDGSIGGDLFF